MAKKEERCDYCGQQNETKYMENESKFTCTYCRKSNDRFGPKEYELLKILEELK